MHVVEGSHQGIERSRITKEHKALFIIRRSDDYCRSNAFECNDRLAQDGVGNVVLRYGVAECGSDSLKACQTRGCSISSRLRLGNFPRSTFELFVCGLEGFESSAQLVRLPLELEGVALKLASQARYPLCVLCNSQSAATILERINWGRRSDLLLDNEGVASSAGSLPSNGRQLESAGWWERPARSIKVRR